MAVFPCCSSETTATLSPALSTSCECCQESVSVIAVMLLAAAELLLPSAFPEALLLTRLIIHSKSHHRIVGWFVLEGTLNII